MIVTMPHTAARIRLELTGIAAALEANTAERSKLEQRRRDWIRRGLEAGPKTGGRRVSYRDMAEWAGLTSARIAQILKEDQQQPATT